MSKRQRCDLDLGVSNLPSPASFSHPKSSLRAGWILEEKRWSCSFRTAPCQEGGLPTGRSLQTAAAGVQLPARPMHTKWWGQCPSQAVTQPPSSVWDCVQSSGLRGQLGLGANIFSNQVAYDLALMSLFSESFSYPHQENGGSLQFLQRLTKASQIKHLVRLPVHRRY